MFKLLQTFLYLRTRTNIENASEAIESLSLTWEHSIELLLPFNDGTWENGLVFGITTFISPHELANTMRRGLNDFDAWAIHSLKGEYVESPQGGPLSLYYEAIRSSSSPSRTAQIFLGIDEVSDKSRGDDIVASIRAIYGYELCRPVFHFRDGRILLTNTSDPARIIFRRVETAVHKRVYDISVCDWRGDSCSDDGRLIWDTDWLENLEFSA